MQYYLMFKKRELKLHYKFTGQLDKLVEIGKIHKVESRNAFIACQKFKLSNFLQATAFSICEVSVKKFQKLSNSKLSKYLSNFSDNTGMQV